jgi:hypothetical protein
MLDHAVVIALTFSVKPIPRGRRAKSRQDERLREDNGGRFDPRSFGREKAEDAELQDPAPPEPLSGPCTLRPSTFDLSRCASGHVGKRSSLDHSIT